MDIVKQIVEVLEAQVLVVVPDFKLLDNKHDLEKNNFYNSVKRYGVVALDGTQGDSALRYYTINRTFKLKLLQKFVSAVNADNNQDNAQYILEDAIDTITAKIMNNRLGIPNIVNNITISNIDDPDFTTLENMLIMEVDYIVQYKNAITSC